MFFVLIRPSGTSNSQQHRSPLSAQSGTRIGREPSALGKALTSKIHRSIGGEIGR